MTTGETIAVITASAFVLTGVYFITDKLTNFVSKAISNRKKETNKKAAVPTPTLIGLRCAQVEHCVCITTYGALPVEYIAIRTYVNGEVNIRPLLKYRGEINPEKIYGIFLIVCLQRCWRRLPRVFRRNKGNTLTCWLYTRRISHGSALKSYNKLKHKED